MTDQNEMRPIRRRRKRRPKWQRVLHHYWPLIRFVLLTVAVVMLAIFSVKAVARILRPNTSLSVERTAETTADTEPTETLVAPQIVLDQAARLAAGYDYQGAVQLLQGYEAYSEVPEMERRVTEYTRMDSMLVSYPEMDSITHIFFHSLIVDPARAFDGDFTEGGYNQYMTTVDEFKAILQSMYDRGYVLVTPYDIAYETTDAGGTHFVYGDIRLPEGKTPFVMSQDDLNYYGYMIGNQNGSRDNPVFATAEGDGFADRIVIGEDGYPTCRYMESDGTVTTGDYDLVPILERFIQEHPDFSYHGARAVLGVTGYEGVFGYRTKPAYEAALGSTAYQEEVREAKEVAQCLREHGWILASHSYAHPAYGELSSEEVEIDSDKWKKTVEPIIGPVDIFIYPYGSDIAGVENYSLDNLKFKALYEDGFRYYYNVDGHRAWCQMGDDYFRGGRRNLDGYRMYYNPSMLEDLFDVSAVFDSARPTPVPPM